MPKLRFPSRTRLRKAAIDYENHPVFSTRPKWRRELHRIIVGHLTVGGETFDALLLGAILASTTGIILSTVDSIGSNYADQLQVIEWVFTGLFVAEYGCRLIAARSALRYAFSPWGIVDLLGAAPAFLALVVPEGDVLGIVRIARVMRIFRVLHMVDFLIGEQAIVRALRASSYRIVVFLLSVVTVATVVGGLMFLVEGPEAGFVNVPISVYWAIVTLTTVGYGDITPVTWLGRTLAAFLMIMGYGVIAVPSSVVAVEMAKLPDPRDPEDVVLKLIRTCEECGAAGHREEAVYCRLCGYELPVDPDALEEDGF